MWDRYGDLVWTDYRSAGYKFYLRTYTRGKGPHSFLCKIVLELG